MPGHTTCENFDFDVFLMQSKTSFYVLFRDEKSNLLFSTSEEIYPTTQQNGSSFLRASLKPPSPSNRPTHKTLTYPADGGLDKLRGGVVIE